MARPSEPAQTDPGPSPPGGPPRDPADLLLLVGASGRLLRWNAGLERLTGRAGDLLRATTFHQLMVPRDRARMRSFAAAAFTEPRPPIEADVLLPDGARSYRWHATPYPSQDPRTAAVLLLAEDRTLGRREEDTGAWDLRDTWRLAEAQQRQTTMFRVFAHELNTPLTPLKLQVHMLKNSVPDPCGRHSIDILGRNLDRLSGMVRDMLDLARMQAGRFAVSPTPMDLTAIVGEVVETFAAWAARARVQLQASTPPSLPLVADAPRLTQVLYNLVSNAIKFSPSGGRVLVTAGQTDGQMFVRVEDQGPGFTAEQSEGLFHPFSRLHEASRPAISGTGLGLSVSRQIAERHGGKLSGRSEGPGRGSAFTLTLPLPRDACAQKAAMFPSPIETK